MVDVLVIRVQIVQHDVSVARVTSCEHDDLKVLAQVFEDFLCVWPDVDPSLDDLSCGKCDR
jgi:hypothetical protein